MLLRFFLLLYATTTALSCTESAPHLLEEPNRPCTTRDDCYPLPSDLTGCRGITCVQQQCVYPTLPMEQCAKPLTDAGTSVDPGEQSEPDTPAAVADTPIAQDTPADSDIPDVPAPVADDPGADPTPVADAPEATSDPIDLGIDSGLDPSTDPGPAPVTDPGLDPGIDPGADPGEPVDTADNEDPSSEVEVQTDDGTSETADDGVDAAMPSCTELENGAACEPDGDPCTADVCRDGVCIHPGRNLHTFPSSPGIFAMAPVQRGGFVLAGDGSSSEENGDRAFAAQVDSAGMEAWSHVLGADTEQATLSGVAPISALRTAVVGTWQPPSTEGDSGPLYAWLVVLSNTSGQTFHEIHHGSDDFDHEALDVIAPEAGGFLTCGIRSGRYGSNRRMWVLRTDEAGETLWEHTYEELGVSEAVSVRELPSGGFVVAGVATSTDGPWHVPVYLVVDPAGELRWHRMHKLGYDSGIHDVTVSEDGTVTVVGTGNTGDAAFRLVLLQWSDEGTLRFDRTGAVPGTLLGGGIRPTGNGFILTGSQLLPEASSRAWTLRTDEAGNAVQPDPTILVDLPSDSIAIAPTSEGGYAVAGSVEVDGKLVGAWFPLDANGELCGEP